MDTPSETYRLALPWYKQSDFDELWALAEDRAVLPRSYSEWHQRASGVYSRFLNAGMAIQIVSVRRTPLLKWLSDHGLRNTSAARRLYVEDCAVARARLAQGSAMAWVTLSDQ